MGDPTLSGLTEDASEYLDWDLSNLDTSELPTSLNNPIDLYLECEDDVLYSASQSLKPTIGPSLIGQNVHLQISFPQTSVTKTVVKTISCGKCTFSFQSDKQLKRHLKDVHNIEKPHKCLNCNFNTSSIKLLNRHIKRCAKKLTSIKPSLSITGNLSINGPIVEINQSEDGEIQKTKSCVATTDSDSSSPVDTTSQSNIVLESNSSQYKNSDTEICLRVSNSKPQHGADVIQQNAFSTNRNTFQCKKCTFQTKSSKLLKSHQKYKHNSQRLLLNCTQCDFTCLQKRTYLIHLKSHENDKSNIACDICLKTFLSFEKLKRHKLSHSNERPYQCDVCLKSFKIAGMLTDHKKLVHLNTVKKSNVKSIKCTWPECEKCFRDNYNLKTHYKTHDSSN